MFFWEGDRNFKALRFDPAWHGPGPNEANDRIRHELEEYIRSEIGERPELVEAVTPQYPPYTKRLVVDNGWYRALTNDHVQLVTNPPDRAVSDGVYTADGTHFPLDVIVLATGFHGTRFFWPIDLRGREGCSIEELWGNAEDARAYLGCCMSGFPNFFALHGPNSTIGHGGAATFISECQAHYIGELLEFLVETQASSIEVKTETFEQYNKQLDEELDSMVWSDPAVGSRYKNRSGRNVMTHPFTLHEFWLRTRKPDVSEFKFDSCRNQDGK